MLIQVAFTSKIVIVRGLQILNQRDKANILLAKEKWLVYLIQAIVDIDLINKIFLLKKKFQIGPYLKTILLRINLIIKAQKIYMDNKYFKDNNQINNKPFKNRISKN